MGALALLACGERATPAEPETAASEGGEAASEGGEAVSAAESEGARALADLEQRLRDARAITIECAIESEGAVESTLSGRIELAGADAHWEVTGTFAGRPTELSLLARAGDLRGGNGESSFDTPRPPELGDAIVTGLVRMGLLHNLASLASGEPPDVRATSASGWVVLRDVVLEPAREVDGVTAIPVRFGIDVGGQPMAEGILYLDAARMLPVRREQTVHFEQGDMRVVERYARFELG